MRLIPWWYKQYENHLPLMIGTFTFTFQEVITLDLCSYQSFGPTKNNILIVKVI